LSLAKDLTKSYALADIGIVKLSGLPLKEPAMITNRTTPTLIIVNRLFTVDDSFTPSASATEMHRIIKNF